MFKIQLLGLMISWIIITQVSQIQAQISGVVTDQNTKPIPDVSISNHHQVLAITDADGKFFINQRVEDSLYFAHIAYHPQKIKVAQQHSLHVVLTIRQALVEEIQILGQWADTDQAITQYTLSAEDIERRDYGQDMPTQLRWSPSVLMHSDAGTGIGYSYMRIRGSDQERTAVSINGVPLNDAESQQVFWVDLPDFASSAKSIQIQRGLGLSSHGPGAFGASIQINTQEVPAEPQLSATLGYGSFNSSRIQLKAATGLLQGKYFVKARGSLIRSDGFVDRASSDLKSYFISAGLLDTEQSLTLHVFSGHEITYQAWNGIPFRYAAIDSLRSYNPSGTEKSGAPYEDEVDNYRQTHTQLIYKRQFTDRFRLNLTGHYTRGLGYFELYKSGKLLRQFGLQAPAIDSMTIGDIVQRRWLSNHFYGAISSLSYSSKDLNSEWVWGGAYNTYLGDHFGRIIWSDITERLDPGIVYYQNDAKKSDFNTYLQWKYQWGPRLNTFIDFQYRRVAYAFEGPDEDGEILDRRVVHHFVNPKIGLNLNIHTQSRLYAYLGYGSKEPNRNDYVESSPRSAPRPERLLNAELGIYQKWGAWTLGSNLYWMQYKDQLIPTGQLNDVGAATRVNVEASYRRGSELSLDFRKDRYTWRFGCNYSQNKIKSFDFYVDQYDPDYNYVGQRKYRLTNTALALSPQLILTNSISFRLSKYLTADMDMKYVGRQYLDNTSTFETSLDPYWTLDLHTRLKLVSGLDFKLGVFNLLGQAYETFGWTYPYEGPSFGTAYSKEISKDIHRELALYPQAGRYFMLSLQWNIL